MTQQERNIGGEVVIVREAVMFPDDPAKRAEFAKHQGRVRKSKRPKQRPFLESIRAQVEAEIDGMAR
jgi:hypothetical protein